ncbi:MAG: 2-amino-4-hydroxy-6-hydroxymethyldihydropteridine diphosphokinase [Acidobacteria bacterium]|nr:2-amino-4-hydroxy-6-hydroxymethyldihydropteridine diphosphokinase [Acidobacteriota bacterium]
MAASCPLAGLSSTIVAIALGSNLGDRTAHLAHGFDRLASVLADLRRSSPRETAPQGVEAQPPFLNAAAVGVTRLQPRALLDTLLAIESERGRTRARLGLPRTLDLDLILYGQDVIDEPGLQVPHPRFRERLFVLEPLAELAADWTDPVTGKTVQQLLQEVRSEK